MKRSSVIPDDAKLKKMKVAELRDWCGACSLGEKGNKDALIGRLKEARSDGLRSPGGRSGGPTTPQKQTVSKAQSQAEQRRKQIEKLFQKYSSGAKEIGMEGFLSLGLDLAGGSEEMSSTPEHTFFLFVISWRMKSQHFGEIKEGDFRTGMEAMGVSSLEEMVQSKPRLISHATRKVSDLYGRGDSDSFRDMYHFVFDILRPEGKKYVEKDMAELALQAFFQGVPGRTSPHVEGFLEFLRSQDKILSLNLDQWRGFLQFSRDVDAGFSGYSDEDPWPSLLDEFVTWSKAQPKWLEKHGSKPAA